MLKALIIIANNGFQDTEYAVPKEILEKAGIETAIAAGKKGPCSGKFGASAHADHSLNEAHGGDYDAVVFVGGPGCLQEYRGNKDYLRLAREAKIIGAICIAPFVIADSGVFNGRKVTGWDSGGEQRAHIESQGAVFTGDPVTIDGNIITGNGPEAAEEFGKSLVKALRN